MVKDESSEATIKHKKINTGFSHHISSSRYFSITGWRLFVFLIAAIVLIPIGVIFASFISPETEIWQHLVETTLPGLLVNTFWLSLGVVIGTMLLGVSLAWFTAVFEFPGRRFFSWALLLPFAIPAYVTAFVALGIFDFTIILILASVSITSSCSISSSIFSSFQTKQ